MRAKTLQIVWHTKEPVFSLDFHPSGVLATGGGDREVKVRLIRLLTRSKLCTMLAKRLHVQTLPRCMPPSNSCGSCVLSATAAQAYDTYAA